jgi:RING finger family protein
MLEIGALAILVAGASYGYSLYQKGRAHARFKLSFEEIARKLGGRASPGTIFDAPELRLMFGDAEVLLRLRGIEHPDRGVAIAEVPLSAGASSDMLRLYVGWDVSSVPRGLEHIPEIPFPRVGLDGRLIVRTNDAAIASQFIERAVPDLSEVRREARARALEILCRGGSLQVAVHGIRDSAIMLERIVFAALRMRELVQAIRKNEAPARHDPAPERPRSPPPPSAPEQASPPPEPPAPAVACTLCAESKKKDEAWVACSRCRAPYHRRCWAQATGCIEKDCPETRALAFDGAPR